MTAAAEVVDVAASAATDHIFSVYSRSEVTDLDVSVTFKDGELLVDIFLDTNANSPASEAEAQRVVDDAALVATDAVDRFLDQRDEHSE